MAKKHIMKASHTQMDYASLDSQGTKALVASQGEALAAEAKNISINSKAKEIALPFLPSVHTMLTNAYSVIDMEVRRLGREAHMGLDRSDTLQFEKYVTSLVRLANLENNIRDTSELEAMSDKNLEEAVKKALERGAEVDD